MGRHFLSWRSQTPPARAKSKLKPNALPDILWTSLLALKESSDAFPPLKSVVAAAVAICTIAERTKHSQENARTLALRVKDILDVLADAVSVECEVREVPASMLTSIAGFARLLGEIRDFLDNISNASKMSRLLHLNRNEMLLFGFEAHLDDAYRDFLAASALRLEVQQAQLAQQQKQLALQQAHLLASQKQFSVQQLQTESKIQEISSTTDGILLYSQLTFFWPSPDASIPVAQNPFRPYTPIQPDTHNKPLLAGQRARGHFLAY
ncbi:hypothetical protein R3P38DRAFT_3255180 [Favolaschia claudopus]|uniref:Fungal N-terminal domain-containing protein n=1 Tax=Favolaschia claudopus TaxID=2862362 RepID=A0AAW0DLG3_9AGAR